MAEPADGVRLSRRSVVAGIAGGVAASGAGVPGFALGRGGSWDFGPKPPAWTPMEIATGDALLIPAAVAGRAVRGFLDSGSGATAVSLGLAARLGLPLDEPRTLSGLSGRAAVRLVRGVELRLAGLARTPPFIIAADLGTLSAAFGRAIDLVLGADMLVGSCVALDFGNARFAVAPTGAFRAGRGWSPLPLAHGRKRELFVQASVAGLPPAPLMLDLGSASALMLSSEFVAANRLSAGRRVSTAAIGDVEGVRGVEVFTTERLRIGGLPVVGVPTAGVPGWLSQDTVGNLGLPLIAQFDAVLDVTAGMAWLRPPASGRGLPMLRDRSGLGLSVSTDALTVVHVASNSPAARTGWTIGERIVAVENHRIDLGYTHGSLWRWRFWPAGRRVGLSTAAGPRVIELADYY